MMHPLNCDCCGKIIEEPEEWKRGIIASMEKALQQSAALLERYREMSADEISADLDVRVEQAKMQLHGHPT
jgi:hypothetical protein